MRAIGCVRQIDKLGRLVLPSDIRRMLNIKDGAAFFCPFRLFVLPLIVKFPVIHDIIICSRQKPFCFHGRSSFFVFYIENFPDLYYSILRSFLSALRTTFEPALRTTLEPTLRGLLSIQTTKQKTLRRSIFILRHLFLQNQVN